MVELALRFLIVGALAFGGGGAALPLVERLTVEETGWLTHDQFAVGVGLSYATPGPILVLAAFVGHYVGGLAGATLASVAVFTVPVALAGLTAQLLERFRNIPWLADFARFAAAAAIGLLGVTLVSFVRPVLALEPLLLLGAAVVALADARGVSPVLLIVAAAAIGAGAAVVSSADFLPR
jgi:chromate transporter